MKELAREGQLLDQTVVLAEKQLSGRGQMGNTWFSKEGQSLTFSIYKGFEALPADRQFLISMAVSLGIVSTLKDFDVPNASVKWPNDIMSAKNKIGGILIENVLEGSFVKYSVIGIGLNVNITDFPSLPQASSMKLETGRTFEMDELLQAILKSVFKHLENCVTIDLIAIKKNYENNLFRKDIISVFENPNGLRFNGIIKGVSDIGELLVETENKQSQKFQLKEIKLIY